MKHNPYDAGVLQEEVHSRLVADLDKYALDAGILPHWIYNPLPSSLTIKERDYLVNFRQHVTGQTGVSGLSYVGDVTKTTLSLEDRFSALAGCLVRNFVRARVMTVGTLLEHLHSKDVPDVSCLLIPNFFYAEAEGGGLAKWQVSALMDLFSHRHIAGKQTIIYLSDKAALKKEYGLNFGETIRNNFLEVAVS